MGLASSSTSYALRSELAQVRVRLLAERSLDAFRVDGLQAAGPRRRFVCHRECPPLPNRRNRTARPNPFGMWSVRETTNFSGMLISFPGVARHGIQDSCPNRPPYYDRIHKTMFRCRS